MAKESSSVDYSMTLTPSFSFGFSLPDLQAERKRKKTGAAANHAKVAEKLFAAQMRREAVKQAQA